MTAQTANGLKATKIKGYTRVYLIETSRNIDMIEIKPGAKITDVNTTDFYRFEDDRNTFHVMFHADKWNKADFEGEDYAIPGWHVDVKNNTYVCTTKAEVIRHLRMELAQVKSSMWSDAPTQKQPATSRKPKGTKFEYYDRGAWTPERKTVRVVFEDAGYDRINVRRADNNRLLGWVYGPDSFRSHLGNQWSAHIADEAFQGDSVDDVGYYGDKVPDSLHQRTAGYGRIEGKTRKEVIEAMLTDMSSRRPPALGYGRHSDVERYYGDDLAKRAWVLNGYEGVPADYATA